MNKQCKFPHCGLMNDHMLKFTLLGNFECYAALPLGVKSEIALTKWLSQQGEDYPGHDLDLLYCDFGRQRGRRIHWV